MNLATTSICALYFQINFLWKIEKKIHLNFEAIEIFKVAKMETYMYKKLGFLC